MNRVLVTGNAGSGKSTLAALLASRLDLPYVGMDRIVWRSRWNKAPRLERIEAESDIANQATWIVDGVSDIVLGAADTVVLLDFSRPRCYWHALKRNVPYLFKSRPGLPANCPEILILPTLVKIIWRFPKHVRPRILNACAQGKSLVHIRSNSDLARFIESLRAPNKLLHATAQTAAREQ